MMARRSSRTILCLCSHLLTKDGSAIDVPQGIYMIAFVNFQVLVSVAEANWHFANDGQMLTTSAIPTGAISMLTTESGLVLYSTSGIRLLWNVSRKVPSMRLASCNLRAKGDGTITDVISGTPNEKVDGRPR